MGSLVFGGTAAKAATELEAHGELVLAVYAAAHVLSSNPPDPKVKYRIELSADGGKSWRTVVKDWSIPRRGEEPKDFWSQSMCWGALDLARTIVRRAERRCVTLIREGSVENPQVRRYLNRLSLLLFVLGRYEEARGGRSAEPAKPAPG